MILVVKVKILSAIENANIMICTILAEVFKKPLFQIGVLTKHSQK